MRSYPIISASYVCVEDGVRKTGEKKPLEWCVNYFLINTAESQSSVL